MLYDAMAYGHLEAEAEASVAHVSSMEDGSSCSILHAGIPSRHCHVHDHDHMSDRVLVGGCTVRPVLVKVEAWRVEPAPDDSEKLLGRELLERHDLANSNVHGWALILCSPLCLGVVEL